jgi:hypothetical protein
LPDTAGLRPEGGRKVEAVPPAIMAEVLARLAPIIS